MSGNGLNFVLEVLLCRPFMVELICNSFAKMGKIFTLYVRIFNYNIQIVYMTISLRSLHCP